MNGELLRRPNRKRIKKATNRESLRKKVALKRKKRLIYRRLFLVVSCLLVVFSFFFGVYFLLSKFFSVKNISIQGESKYSDSEIISAGKIGIGSSMLFLNSKNIENNIYKSLADIDNIKISKKFPNKLVVGVESAKPTYHLKVDDGYIVISSKDKFLTKVSEPPEGTIGIVGMECEVTEIGKVNYKNTELKSLFEEILGTFKDNGINDISEIDVSDLQNITLIYDNRIRINLGNKEDIDYKILTLKEILNNKISKTEKGTLNLKDLKNENRTYFTYE